MPSGRSIAVCPQGVPTGIDGWRTGACASVTVGSARRAESETVFAAEGEPRYREQPLFANCRAQVDNPSAWRQRNHIIFFCLVHTGFGKQKLHFVFDRDGNVCQATAARGGGRSFQMTAEIKAAVSRAGQPARYVDAGAFRTRVAGFPDGISGVKGTVNALSPSFQASDVKIQHSHEK